MKELQTKSEISYFSEGTGIPIIFIHGLSLDKNSTAKFFESFIRPDFQRIYLDLPGMGNSQSIFPATSNNVLKRLIDFIKEVIGSRQFILYGHSYGAYLSLAVADQLPNQVLGMFLTCPVITSDKVKRITAQPWNLVEETVNVTKNKAYWDDFMNMNVIINQQTWETYQELIIPGLNSANQKFIKELSQNYTLKNETDLKQLNYDFPIKILAGYHDQVVGFKEQLNFVKNNNDILILKNAGHNLMIDQPQITNTQFNNFVDLIQ